MSVAVRVIATMTRATRTAGMRMIGIARTATKARPRRRAIPKKRARTISKMWMVVNASTAVRVW